MAASFLAGGGIMSRNAQYRREMGMDMPRPQRNIESERYSIKHISNVPEVPKRLDVKLIMGIWMVDDGDGWRSPTVEELEQISGGVIC
jgi:hypothetical protein